MSEKPLFTIIMLTFNRPHLLKEAAAHLFAQTYTNLEIIIINNAATPETQEYLSQLEKKDKRIRLVHFATNQYDPNNPMKFVGICFNAALSIAKGEYVFYQEDDDFISPDYVERMVSLFQGNPQCTTAAGLPVSVNIKGEIMPELRVSNFRPRYVQGHVMALDTLREGGVMFSAPGTIFTIKRDALVQAGGFHPMVESSQLYGIVPFGVTGFDEKAILYWRRHEDQLNLSFVLNGHTTVHSHKTLLKEWDLLKKWEEHVGKSEARFFVHTLIRQKTEVCAYNFMHCLYAFAWASTWRVLSKVWYSWHFWKMLPKAAWLKKWVLKCTLRKIFNRSPKANRTGVLACPES